MSFVDTLSCALSDRQVISDAMDKISLFIMRKCMLFWKKSIHLHIKYEKDAGHNEEF